MGSSTLRLVGLVLLTLVMMCPSMGLRPVCHGKLGLHLVTGVGGGQLGRRCGHRNWGRLAMGTVVSWDMSGTLSFARTFGGSR